MKGVLRRLLEGALEYSDYVLKERSATPVGLRSYMKRLHSFGFDPKTVVGRGRRLWNALAL